MLPPSVFILFGATGDLARKKLIPAMLELHQGGKLNKVSKIIVIGRRKLKTSELLAQYKSQITDAKDWPAFAKRFQYHFLEFDDKLAYDSLKKRLSKLPKGVQDNLVFYLATPQSAFDYIVDHLSRTGIAKRNPKSGWHRVVFEKPFGSDLKTAKKLNKCVTKLFSENQIYRIDHYVGKSFVQEISVLRWANPVFEHLWNAKHIEQIDIVVSETVGVEKRGGYYDHAGALKDMVQNHLLQLLSLTAMEEPKSLDPEHVRDAKSAVLKNVRLEDRHWLKEDMVLGQYSAGKGMQDYKSEKGVAKNSRTETLAAVRLWVDNKRWKGTPFVLFTGKALKEKYAEVILHFRTPSCHLFTMKNKVCGENKLAIRIQPDEGVKFLFNLANKYGGDIAEAKTMNYCHNCEQGMNTPEAYVKLLSDVFTGDQTLFTRWDFVEQAWKITDNLVEKAQRPILYKVGTRGPFQALRLLQLHPPILKKKMK
ncbi:glucose-6-phosphate dehydrogenase [Candidatus Woesearchaeota archaeon]|nr:glucose-6-phosphate dehydrogenase [Candidatus Woesearchaeota archaeon]